MLIVTGATGALGAQIVDQLLTRVPAEEVGVSVRDPAKADALRARGVRVRHGDFADPASLAAAFAGARRVLLASAATTGDTAQTLHRAAVTAARDAGAERILYTSHQAASPASVFAPMPDHAATERGLAASGTAWTALRNGFYASSALLFLGQALETGELVAPEDGPVSWTAHADLAEAAALALTSDDPAFDGATPPLTGPEALDLSALAAIASELTGREITRTTVADADFHATLVARGVPDERATLLVGMFEASRAGEFATVDPTLERLLGRPPTPVRDTLARAVAQPTRA